MQQHTTGSLWKIIYDICSSKHFQTVILHCISAPRFFFHSVQNTRTTFHFFFSHFIVWLFVFLAKCLPAQLLLLMCSFHRAHVNPKLILYTFSSSSCVAAVGDFFFYSSLYPLFRHVQKVIWLLDLYTAYGRCRERTRLQPNQRTKSFSMIIHSKTWTGFASKCLHKDFAVAIFVGSVGLIVCIVRSLIWFTHSQYISLKYPKMDTSEDYGSDLMVCVCFDLLTIQVILNDFGWCKVLFWNFFSFFSFALWHAQRQNKWQITTLTWPNVFWH